MSRTSAPVRRRPPVSRNRRLFLEQFESRVLLASLPDLGLVSWWRAEDNPAGTVAKDWADGNNGTLLNGTTFAPGEVGQAFSFDGVDDVVDIANEANFDFDRTNSFSIDAWINGTPKGVGNQFILSKSGQADD